MSFAIRSRFDWRLRSRTLELGGRTVVMGILNVTPDSFSDGGRFFGVEAAVARGLAMVDEGADVVDVGGESTRPGAAELTGSEEQERVLPVVKRLVRAGVVVSVDTYHAATARMGVEAGAEIVNDVSGGLWDAGMLGACAEMGCGVVLMHTRGRPGEWAGLPALGAGEVLPLVRRELAARMGEALAAGVARESLVADPGFGFGKRGEENYRLLAGFGEFRELGFPVLSGVSRKGFLARTVAEVRGGQMPGADERMTATIAANTAAVLAGAHVLRVHDVRAAVEGAAVADAVLAAAWDGDFAGNPHTGSLQNDGK